MLYSVDSQFNFMGLCRQNTYGLLNDFCRGIFAHEQEVRFVSEYGFLGWVCQRPIPGYFFLMTVLKPGTLLMLDFLG